MNDEKKPMVELVIKFDGATTSVGGPIQNELLCQAMLESAGQVIHEFNVRRKIEEATRQTLTQPQPGLIKPKTDLTIA